MRGAVRTLVALSFLLGGAPLARAELAAWDQARVAALAQQLESAARALEDSLRKQPPPQLGSAQRKPFFHLRHDVRALRRESRSLARALERGADLDETLPSYESLMRTVRSASDIARRVFTSAELQGRADAAREVLNQLGPYFDPAFQPLAPPARR